MAYYLSARVRREVLEIFRYIAADNLPAAETFVDELHHYFQFLERNPRAGRRREEFGRGYRSFPVGDYLIVYRIAEPGIRIMRVVHGRRDPGKLLTH